MLRHREAPEKSRRALHEPRSRRHFGVLQRKCAPYEKTSAQAFYVASSDSANTVREDHVVHVVVAVGADALVAVRDPVEVHQPARGLGVPECSQARAAEIGNYPPDRSLNMGS